MDFVVVCVVSLVVAGLTLFSGFGLGTLLLPAFAIFFPIPVAVAATAVVHLANNTFKLALVGRSADRGVVLRFGLPAVLLSFLGAAILRSMAAAQPLYSYQLGSHAVDVVPVSLIVGVVIVLFALFDLIPKLRTLQIDAKWLPLGGALSGFFGGLSGHQGALRSAFLIKAGLSKEAFIGTGVVVAVLVDLARLAVYGSPEVLSSVREAGPLVLAGCLSALLGSWIGAKALAKVTIGVIQTIVGVLLVLVGAALAMGLI